MSVAVNPYPALSTREAITLFCGCDENYAQHLGVMLYSAIDNVSQDLDIYVLNIGLRRSSVSKLTALARAKGVSITFLDFSDNKLSRFYTSRYITGASYLRLLAPEVLPTECSRAIYLDCDTLVYGDLAELWNMDLKGLAMAAVQDIGRPFIDTGSIIKTSTKRTTISDYAEHGIAPDDPYLNAGVLVLDLDQWRDEGITPKCLEIAANKQYESHDQDVLNVVLHENWLTLPPKWNVAYQVFRLHSFDQGPYSSPEFVDCVVDPRVLHFTGRAKPWQRLCPHPMTKEYWRFLDQTPWQGASPEPIPIRRSLGRLKWRMEMIVGSALHGKPAYLSHIK